MSTELPRRQRTTGTRAKICIVASEYNEQYTQALVENCSEELKPCFPRSAWKSSACREPLKFRWPLNPFSPALRKTS